jgi:hypothetical protein
MFGLFDEILDLAINTTKVVIAPVAIVATVVNEVVVEPAADVAQEIVESIKTL